MRWFLVLAVLALSGCSLKLAGEASVMKKWDRPSETYSISSDDKVTTKEGTK